MKKIALCLALTSLLALGGSAIAEIGTIDAVPAATLLLPYFEVDLANPNGITTLFSVNNASATAVVAHVTVWTDQSIPTLDFDIYLTGYDVQTINIRDIFNGNLPRTADAGSDPGDKISPKGSLSQDINFPGSTGPCANPYPATGALSASLIAHIRAAHTGVFDSLYGGCSGAAYGDNIARGYITVDTVNSCNLSFPSDAGYFTTLATNQNVLWGDFFWINPGQNFATGTTLVHIEACPTPSVGNGAGHCPFSFAAGNYTFYGRYNSVAGQDQREPLATTFASRYINGGTFSGGTDLIVWRDSKTRPVGANGTHSCSTVPSWFPLNQSDVVSFDETENPTNLCFQSDNVSPPTGGTQTCFPLETQRVHLAGGNVIGADPGPPAPFGWIYLNLNQTLASGDPYPGRAQAWVITSMSASGLYEVGYDAIALDNATSSVPGGVVLIP
ncbi:MAG TPA: hypothetical protein VH988_24395 [Thermoanaerobaculia bacterium]|jgi:hypothetical protein|nr:hypothetical protein [Thermoanaerobaculia bacterium]